MDLLWRSLNLDDEPTRATQAVSTPVEAPADTPPLPDPPSQATPVDAVAAHAGRGPPSAATSRPANAALPAIALLAAPVTAQQEVFGGPWPAHDDDPPSDEPTPGEQPDPGDEVYPSATIEALQEWVFESGVLRPAVEQQVWEWRHLVEIYFPESEWATALCVISWESGGRPHVTFANPGDPDDDGIDSLGLFQVDWDNLAHTNRVAGLRSWGYHTRTEAEELLLDPETNVRAAADMVAAEGWLPAWTAQTKRCSLRD